MLSQAPALYHFRGPVRHVSAEVLMDIFTKWLPMETFQAKALLGELQSSLHVRVGKYLEQLGNDDEKSLRVDLPHLLTGKESLRDLHPYELV